MMDREKVIKGLECCVNDLGECEFCPYDEGMGKLACGKNLYSAALALLRAQEPMDAVPVVHGKWHEYHATARGYGKVYYQHSCTPMLYESPYYYCPNCGAKMDSERRDGERRDES